MRLCTWLRAAPMLITRMTLAVALGFSLAAPAHGADKLQILIRAFIPKQHSSTRPIPFGAGDTMVEPPASSIVRCFETDQRSFSTDPAASSRIASIANIVLSSPPTLKQEHPVFDSNAIDCGSGQVINEAKTTNKDQSFSMIEGALLTLKYHASGKNPNVEWAPTIDIDGEFKISPAQKTVTFEGKIDQYPAYEAYVRLNGGDWKKLFQISPEYGKTALDLGFKVDVKTPAVSFGGS